MLAASRLVKTAVVSIVQSCSRAIMPEPWTTMGLDSMTDSVEALARLTLRCGCMCTRAVHVRLFGPLSLGASIAKALWAAKFKESLPMSSTGLQAVEAPHVVEGNLS